MKNICCLLGLTLMFLLGSCYEDLGNYDYSDLNTIDITKMDERVCARGDVLDIIPEFNLNGDTLGNAARYAYSWIAFNKNVPTEQLKKFSLSNERNLYYLMNLPAGAYTIVYTITDKETGLNWIARMGLTVTGAISEGWLFLTEEQQEDGSWIGDISVYARNASDGTFKVLNNILEYSGFPYSKGPRKLVYKKAMGMPKGEIHILTDEAVGWLDDQTDLWDKDQLLKYENLEAIPDNYTLKDFYYFPNARHSLGFTEEGGLKIRAEMSAGAVWGNDIGYLLNNGKKEKFDLAPYVGGYQGMGMNMAYLLFDRKTQSFVTCNWSNPTSNEAECQKLTESWASTGREILYMQSVGWTGRVYALLKDQSGKVWQYTFTVTGPVVMLDPVAGIQELNAPNLANATCFSYNQFFTGFLYYAVGNKVYTYYNGKEILVKTMNGNVTCLKSQFINDGTGSRDLFMKYLVVATYGKMTGEEKEEGTVTLLLPELGKPEVVEVADEVKHLDKVISIDYQK